MNTQIKSENILKVIRNLENVLPAAQKRKNLNMHTRPVSICRTTLCHGGWYAMSTASILQLLNPFEIDFTTGANRMARDLGFKDQEELGIWAHRNSEVWGNVFGLNMFFMRASFYHPTKRPDGALRLSDIIDHWYDVYYRVKALEEKSIKYPDITRELAVLPSEEVPDRILSKELVH